jgi:AcrR family transcriptional regulator
MRSELTETAARLLHQEGPRALSARRLAADAGCSTMMVYTHFGGMSGLVREMVHEGFARLQHYFTLVAVTDDPVADMALLGRAYRYNAIANPHLYAVMFGAAPLSSFSLSEADRQYGRYTLVNVVQCASRCIAADRFIAQDAELVARQMWTAIHGLVTLELGEYLIEPYDADCCLEAQLTALMVSVGDDRDAAVKSVDVSRSRLRTEIEAMDAGGVKPGTAARRRGRSAAKPR